MLGRLRAQYQRAISPLGRRLANMGFSPNMMTVLSLVISGCSAYWYAIQQPLLGAAFIILTGVFDMFDGAIARATGKTTKFGATLDHVTDRYAEFLIVFGIIEGGFTPWYWGLFALFGMIMASFTRAKAESVGGLTSCTVGIAERQEKLLIIIVSSLLHSLINEVLLYGVILVGILSHVTVLQRLHYTYVKTGGN